MVPEYFGQTAAVFELTSAWRTDIVTYRTLMVHLEPDRSNAGLLKIAGDLAERFDARVIAVVACKPVQLDYSAGYAPADLIQQDREKEIKATEAEFRNMLQARIKTLEWRSAVTFGVLSEYIAREARSADLIITGPGSGGRVDAAPFVNIGDLVMQVARPVLVVPAAADELKLEQIIIGWKDTRETQRAVFDALPLLKKAAHVTVVEICAEREIAAAQTRVEDVVGWLKWHSVVAESHASPSTGDDASLLNALAEEQGANMVVAGAYGHSRLREWVLGGVTRDLLLRGEKFSLLSH
jgi:nucleotide-binding universal stress UspA family protein